MEKLSCPFILELLAVYYRRTDCVLLYSQRDSILFLGPNQIYYLMHCMRNSEVPTMSGQNITQHLPENAAQDKAIN